MENASIVSDAFDEDGAVTKDSLNTSTTQTFDNADRPSEGKRKERPDEDNEPSRNLARKISTPQQGNGDRSILSIVSDLFDADSSVVKDALDQLADRCRNTENQVEKNRKDIYRFGGPLAIVKAFQRHATDPEVLAAGCRALNNSSVNDYANKALVSEIGGISEIIKAMKVSPDHVLLQSNACGALGNLARHGRVRELVAAGDGIATILNAMEQHQGEEKLQYNALCALQQLARDADPRCQIAAYDGGQLVIATMTLHLGSGRIQCEGCDVLNKLASHDEETRGAVIVSGALTAIAKAVEIHSLNVDVRRRLRKYWLAFGDTMLRE